MKGITELTAELACGSAPPLLFAKQGDEDSRFLRVRFLFGGKAFSTESVTHTEIRVLKPDGTVTVNDGSPEQDGSILYPLSAQSLTTAGEGKADLLLYGADGELISTVPARLIITPAPVGDEAIESISEYNAMVAEVTAHGEAITALQQQDSDLEESLYSLAAVVLPTLDDLFTALGGLSFKKLTKAEYEALETKSDTTLYFVTDGSKVLMYLGETELKSGTVNEGLATIMAAGTAESPAGAAT